MVGGYGSPQRDSTTEDPGTTVLKNNTIPTWMKAVNRTPTKDHMSYKQYIREEKPILTAKYPFLTSSQIERKLRSEWQKTMRSEKGRHKSNRGSPLKTTTAQWEYLVSEVEADRQERVFSPKLGPRFGNKTYGGGASWIHQSLTPPKIIQKRPSMAMNGILSRSTEKPRSSGGKVSFKQTMPSRERSKSESSMSDERYQPTGSYTPKCNMKNIAQEKEKFDGDIYSLSDSDSDKEHQLTTLHKSTKGSATKRVSATKSARRTSHAHTRVRKSKEHQKTKCALFGQENTGTAEERDVSPQFLGAELSDSDDERDLQLLGLEGNVLITGSKERKRNEKKTRKSASTSSRPTATGRQRTITSMFNLMETFPIKDNSDEKCPKPLLDADSVEPEPTECVQSESDVDMDEGDNDDGHSDHFPEIETTELLSKVSKLKQNVFSTRKQATPQNTEGTNKLIKMIQTPSTDSKTISDLTTPANAESLVQQVIKKASKVPHKKRPSEQVSESENTLVDTMMNAPVSSPKQKKARRSLDVTNTSTSVNAACQKRKTRSVTQPLELESPLAEPFCPNKTRKSSIATLKQSSVSDTQDSERESRSEVEMEFESTSAQNTENKSPPNTSMSSRKPLKETPGSDAHSNNGIETDPVLPSSTVLLTSPKRIPAEPAPNVRRTPVRTPVKRTSTDLHGALPLTPSPRSNVRRAPATPIFRRSPRLTNEQLPVTESPGSIPVFKTPKGIPGKAKSRRSSSPKLKCEETCLIKEKSTHEDTLVPRDLNTDTHIDHLVPSELENEARSQLDASLSGDLNVDKSVHADSSDASDLNNDKSTSSDTQASSRPNKDNTHQNMNVSSFYKSRIKQKKDSLPSDSSHSSKLLKPDVKSSKAKSSKVPKGHSNLLTYFGFGEDLDDHDIDESNNKGNSNAIECHRDEYETNNKCIKENVKPVKAKSGRRKTKDAPDMESQNAVETHHSDYDVDNECIKAQKVPAKARRDPEVSSQSLTQTVQSVVRPSSPKNKKADTKASKLKTSKVPNGPSNNLHYFGFGEDVRNNDIDESNNKENSDPIERHQDKYETDNKCSKENVKPVKAKSGRRKTKDAPEMESPDAVKTQGEDADNELIKENRVPAKARSTEVSSHSGTTSPENRTHMNTSKTKGSKTKDQSCNLHYFGFGEDLDDESNKESPTECHDSDKLIKDNVKPVKVRSGRQKTKNSMEMESSDDVEAHHVNDKHVNDNRVAAEGKRDTKMLKDTPEMENPDACETRQNDDGVKDRCVKESLKPAKTKSGRRKAKRTPETESPDAIVTDENDEEVDNKPSKEKSVSAKAKRRSKKVSDAPEMESSHAIETDLDDAMIDGNHKKEKAKPAKMKASRHKMKEDTAESQGSDYETNDKRFKESVEPVRTKKGKRRSKNATAMESQDAAESYYDDYRSGDTQNILSLNPLDTLVEGFRKKSALQFGGPFNWDSCLQEEEKLLDSDENDMLTGHLTTMAEDEKSDDTPLPSQSQSGMTTVEDALQKLRQIASPNILNMDEFEDYDLEEVLSSLKSSQQSSQVSDLSSLSLSNDQEHPTPTKEDTTAPMKGGHTQRSTSTKKDAATFRKPKNTSCGDRMDETKKTLNTLKSPKMTYGKKRVDQLGQGDGLSWASDLFDDIVKDYEPSQKTDRGAKEKPKSNKNSVRRKQRDKPTTPDVDVCGLFEETPRTSARRLLASSQHQTDGNFQDLFSLKDSSSFFM